MNTFHFLRPDWFLALLPALLLVGLLWRQRSRGGDWQQLVAPALLQALLLDTRRTLRRTPLVLLALGWLLAIVALAGPVWQRQPQPVFRASTDRVMVLDMSPSMAATDLKPDRLAQARLAIRRLLATRKEGRTALVVFSGEPHVVAPLTDDRATIEALLPALAVDIMPVAGNQAAPALHSAGTLLAQVGSRHGSVLLLTDGIADPAASLDAVRKLRRQGVQVSVVGVGTTQGAPVPASDGGFEHAADGSVRMARLEDNGLRALAAAGGGHYQRLTALRPATLFDQGSTHDLSQARSVDHGLQRWVEQGPWLLLPLLLLAAAGFRRGWLGVLVILLLPPPAAHAFSWQDLWLRPDQQASQLLQQGDAQAAARRFHDPHWRAAARYQAGDYAAAAQGFTGTSADSAYNRGNALARSGKLQAALAAYDTALQRQPDSADARYNRDLVKKLLQQQRQNQQKQQKQQKQQQGRSSSQSAQHGRQGKGKPQPGQQGKSGTRNGQPGAAQQPSQGNGRRQAGQSGQGSTQSGKNPATGRQQGKDSGQGKSAAGARQQATARAGKPSASQAGQTGRQAQEQGKAGGAGSHRQAAAQPPATASAGAAQPGAQNASGVQRSTPPPDSAAQARADVAPTPAQRAGKPGEKNASPPPQTEQDIAMEQWLHQVPDDPSGLLRRKFMLEHLLRQKGRTSP